ncbi:unnamed protein product, partial [Amoebophrya sp. A120]
DPFVGPTQYLSKEKAFLVVRFDPFVGPTQYPLTVE